MRSEATQIVQFIDNSAALLTDRNLTDSCKDMIFLNHRIIV